MPKLGLPPLPPERFWKVFFPRKYLPLVGQVHSYRDYAQRVLLADRPLIDQFVRSLRMRDNEVVVEGYAGVGSLTRSLLNGGKPVDEKMEKEQRDRWRERNGIRASNSFKIPKVAEGYPNWIDTFREGFRGSDSDDVPPPPPRRPVPADTKPGNTPRLVVAAEPSPEILIRGLGFNADHFPTYSGTSMLSDLRKSGRYLEPNYETVVFPSEHEDNLLVTYANPYDWKTIPEILSHPRVASQLEGYDKSASEAPTAIKRKWTDPEPPITLVATVPQGDLGEQVAVQWIHSAIGAAHGKPGFIWKWGRVRMAMLCHKNLYDRVMGLPGELAHCKLSIMARALFKITPLPPYHHVPNVDKKSSAVEARPFGKLQNSQTAQSVKATYENTKLPRTITYPSDFYPIPYGRFNFPIDEPLARPAILGLMFEPRLDSPITPENKDEWEYVLRVCFIRQATHIATAISTLGFGASNLAEDLERKDDKFKGAVVPGQTIVRDLTEEQWVRIVDVFSKWPFKPTNLDLDLEDSDLEMDK